MKTRTYFLLFASGLFFCTLSYGQQKWSIHASAGTGFDRKAFEGHFFAFHLGIPVNRYLDVAPTFLGYSRIGEPHTGIHISATSADGSQSIGTSYLTNAGPGSTEKINTSSQTVGVAVVFKTISFLNSFREKESKHELSLSWGLGLTSEVNSIGYYDFTEVNTVIFHSTQMGRKITPNLFRIAYSYDIRENVSLGATLWQQGHFRTRLLAGLEVGIKF